MASPPYSVNQLTEIKLSWFVRFRLRSIRKKSQTGVILYGIIRTPARSMSSKAPSIAVREGSQRLGFCSPRSRLPKYAHLAPGQHNLLFRASRPVSSSSFLERVTLAEGDVLVAICEPVQPWVFYAKSPEMDTWYLGIIDSSGVIRSVD